MFFCVLVCFGCMHVCLFFCLLWWWLLLCVAGVMQRWPPGTVAAREEHALIAHLGSRAPAAGGRRWAAEGRGGLCLHYRKAATHWGTGAWQLGHTTQRAAPRRAARPEPPLKGKRTISGEAAERRGRGSGAVWGARGGEDESRLLPTARGGARCAAGRAGLRWQGVGRRQKSSKQSA